MVLSTYAQEVSNIPFQEQSPLKMRLPNEGKAQQSRWIAIAPDPQELPMKNTTISSKPINDVFKEQIQKKIQNFLKPLDDENEQ